MSLIALIIGALMIGSIYSIVGMGYCMIYKSSGLMNLAQGDFLMIGAYIGITFYKILKLPYGTAVILTIMVMFLLGLVIQRSFIVPLLSKGGVFANVILCTSAVSLALQNGARLIWGPVEIKFPSVFDVHFVKIFGNSVAPESLLVLLFSFAGTISLYIFLNKTKYGTAMRAEAMDPLAASSVGINVPHTRAVAWGISAAICGLIGVAIGPVYGVFLTMGAIYTQKGFGAAVLGGYGNLIGALVGGLIYGFLETFVTAFVTSTFKDVIVFGVLIISLTFMPTGIFREPVIE